MYIEAPVYYEQYDLTALYWKIIFDLKVREQRFFSVSKGDI